MNPRRPPGTSEDGPSVRGPTCLRFWANLLPPNPSQVGCWSWVRLWLELGSRSAKAAKNSTPTPPPARDATGGASTQRKFKEQLRAVCRARGQGSWKPFVRSFIRSSAHPSVPPSLPPSVPPPGCRRHSRRGQGSTPPATSPGRGPSDAFSYKSRVMSSGTGGVCSSREEANWGTPLRPAGSWQRAGAGVLPWGGGSWFALRTLQPGREVGRERVRRGRGCDLGRPPFPVWSPGKGGGASSVPLPLRGHQAPGGQRCGGSRGGRSGVSSLNAEPHSEKGGRRRPDAALPRGPPLSAPPAARGPPGLRWGQRAAGPCWAQALLGGGFEALGSPPGRGQPPCPGRGPNTAGGREGTAEAVGSRGGDWPSRAARYPYT